MGTRNAERLIALAWLGAWGCTRPPASALAPGTPFPMAAQTSAPTQVVWVVRPADYLTCQTAAGGIREFQRQAGRGVPLTVLYVGPHAPWLGEFLARQRIRATIVPIDEHGFRRAFHRSPGPWLYLLRHGVVRGVLPGQGYVRPASQWATLMQADTRRQDSSPPAGAAVTSSQGARQ